MSGQIETLPTQLPRDRAARASFTGADVNTGPTSLFNVVTRLFTTDLPALPLYYVWSPCPPAVASPACCLSAAVPTRASSSTRGTFTSGT